MGEKFKPEIYTAKEFRALLKTFSTKYPTGVRNAAMVAAAYAGGLRCAEVLGLRVKDVRNVDDDEGECFIQNGKGSKSRTVCLSASAMKRINAWKKMRREILKERGVKSAPLFCTLDGKPVQSQYVRAMMTRAGAKAKLTKRCHFHGLRHSFAMETVRGKTPLNVVRKALGHSSLAVTTVYLDHINGDDLREAANAVPEF